MKIWKHSSDKTSLTFAYLLTNLVSIPASSSTTLPDSQTSKHSRAGKDYVFKLTRLAKQPQHCIGPRIRLHTRRRRHTAVSTRSSARGARRWRRWGRVVLRWRRWRRTTAILRRRTSLRHLALVVIGVLLLGLLRLSRSACSSVSRHDCTKAAVGRVWVFLRVLCVVCCPGCVELLLLGCHGCGSGLSSSSCRCGRRRLCASTISRGGSLRTISSAVRASSSTVAIS